ncbi:MAG TPA: biopolymer transporter ExbD [Cyclobacteriaceae bacterium]|nr:biopolymer transporter ExbD [Cyclobacteriaceae bacterium]MCB9238722.1 biopolymer transporter ExbD [Flammeovirgaceae bacterium]MCB0497998.1 biopolymer transporter ExbD [Cyclobacteriaceae bacterium]MCO5270440.1 biopolymer transporter ExbD [Cyclobacteriaceae bacterium]MCW5901118.1 biopolymer transporter ExbD [Cyclobacteriaceae bacterium]
MSKFRKKTKVKQDIPTSSMPDVVFMLLFFFMVTTELRKTAVDVMQRIPQATQLRKLQRKSLVTNLYIGEPKKSEQFGTEPKIQADDAFIEPSDIILWVNRKKDELPENEREQLTIAMKVDREAKRGIIADVETELRKANARKILYSTLQKSENR